MTKPTNQNHLAIAFDGDELTTITQEDACDDVFASLADEQRRCVLRELSGETSPLALESLVSRVAKLECADAASPSEADKSRTRVSLHHHTLPKLDAADLIDYDRDERTVESDFETLRLTRA